MQFLHFSGRECGSDCFPNGRLRRMPFFPSALPGCSAIHIILLRLSVTIFDSSTAPQWRSQELHQQTWTVYPRNMPSEP